MLVQGVCLVTSHQGSSQWLGMPACDSKVLSTNALALVNSSRLRLPVLVSQHRGLLLLGADEENRDLGLLHASATGNIMAGDLEGMMAPTARPRRTQRAPSWMLNFRSVEEAGKQVEHREESGSAPQVGVFGVVELVGSFGLQRRDLGLRGGGLFFCPLSDARTGSKSLHFLLVTVSDSEAASLLVGSL